MKINEECRQKTTSVGETPKLELQWNKGTNLSWGLNAAPALRGTKLNTDPSLYKNPHV